jgi:hypothetical protein
MGLPESPAELFVNDRISDGAGQVHPGVMAPFQRDGGPMSERSCGVRGHADQRAE